MSVLFGTPYSLPITVLFLFLFICDGFHHKIFAFRFQTHHFSSSSESDEILVMVNGLPGPMAMETAMTCLDRGYRLIPFGFTGPNCKVEKITVQGRVKSVDVNLIKGPGISENAVQELMNIKRDYPSLIVVDYTHPSATLNNVACYVECNCDFVMGTTGGNMDELRSILGKGSNTVVIAPNMAKQIVALQATIQQMASRFPNSFKDYTLTVKKNESSARKRAVFEMAVTESHQSTKADTSGTAKAIVSHLTSLTSEKHFDIERDVVKLRDPNVQLDFGVPFNSLNGHAFHTYRLISPDNSVVFELQHNVCGRRVYAEGTVDAVEFVSRARNNIMPNKRLFNMIDVLESGSMN